jgi:hypothetical protein
MHVETVDDYSCAFDDTHHMPELMDGNSKLRVDMPSTDLIVSSCHDVWIETETDRDA